MRVWCVLAVVVPAVLSAQSRDDEVRLARSAAPASIAKDAKVYVLDNGHYVVADPGRSGEVCMVNKPDPISIAPECGDAEAAATVLTVDRFVTEQRLAGQSKAEIDKAVKDGYSSGRFRSPKRPALIFMLSSGQRLVNPQGKDIGKFYPHVMIYYPGMTDSEMGIVDSDDLDMPGVLDSGKPGAALVVVARNWVDPSPQP